MSRSSYNAFVLALILSVSMTSGLSSQLIPIRTVPVASGDQFRLVPSETMGMGGVRYALDDALSDPWANPAKGALLEESLFLTSPTLYSISERGGNGRSFPVAGLFAGAEWFGGASLSLQQIENEEDNRFFISEAIVCCGSPRTLSESFGRNLYASGFLGRRLGTGPWSIGAGFSAATLETMDGVELLYASADRVEQSGDIEDFRVGLFRAGDRDRLSLLAVHNRVSMTHDVTFVEWFWNDVAMTSSTATRLEHNEDKTRTWGAEASWDRTLDAPGWRIGASAAVNRKSHPKIPNYSLQNIPRDPGTTWAYEVGFGFAMSEASSTFGLDVVLQPIWSTTWQEADATDVSASSGRLSVGDRSIENDFFFTNVLVRSGLSHNIGIVGLQTGIEIRSYGYQLDQVNRVNGTFRDQKESWVEWSPTFGSVFEFDALDLRYSARITTGTGRPGVANNFFREDASFASVTPDFILAPEGPLTLQDARVLTHQISVVIPIR
jgi:hypothetical protein